MSKLKNIVFSILPVMLLLMVLEITGRIIYPFDEDKRAMIKAERDPRLNLSYLSVGGDGKNILFDVHRKQSRYLPFLGWIGKPDIKLPTISTNALGFRDAPLQPRTVNEYRILLLGGSTAWGLGASSNESTVSGALESLLNSAEGDITFRVISGAYPAWQSRQEMVALIEYYSDFDPDLVIALTGYNDLYVLTQGGNSDQQMRSESRMLADAVDETLRPMSTMQAIRKVAGSLGIWRIVVYFREMEKNSRTVSHMLSYAQTDSEHVLPRVVDRYVVMSDFLKRNGSTLLVALQPDIYTTKKVFSREERKVKDRFTGRYTNIEEVYSRYRQDALVYFSSVSANEDAFSVTDLVSIFDGSDEPVFLDDCHLNDRGYMMVAENLGDVIKMYYLQPWLNR